MAIHSTITPSGTFEAPRNTEMSRAFTQILQAQASFILAERDLEDVGHSQDPAYESWLRDAQCAQEHLTGSIRLFHALPLEAVEDRPLQRMATLIDTMLSNDEPGGARRLHRDMQVAFFAKYQTRGLGATAMHRNALLLHCLHLTSAMVALPIFDGFEITDLEPDQDLPPVC